jgi:hypothetical protein
VVVVVMVVWVVGVIVVAAEVGPSGEREAFERAYQTTEAAKKRGILTRRAA